jgi:hypothetical protein
VHVDWAFYRELIGDLMAGRRPSGACVAWAREAFRPPAARRAERDRLLRRAAKLLPPAPPWTKAEQLRAMALAASRALPAAPDESTPRGCVASALLIYAGRRPPSARQVYRVLTDMDGVEMSAGAAER